MHHHDHRGEGGHGDPRESRERSRRQTEGGRECGGSPEPRGPGPDTRFLQLEMSQVLLGEAESVTRDAMRELLRDAAKDRLRERFGDQLRALAELAVDELLDDIFASLEVEKQIRARAEQRSERDDRLRRILGGESR